MQDYELTVLIHPDLEANLDAPLQKVRDIITGTGGEITSEENWGKKKLAYRIKSEDFAVYVCMDMKLPADAPQKIGNTFNITDEVLRYLLVRTDEKGRRALEDAKANERSDGADREE
jgi:small subunit ribosomal protein S6